MSSQPVQIRLEVSEKSYCNPIIQGVTERVYTYEGPASLDDIKRYWKAINLKKILLTLITNFWFHMFFKYKYKRVTALYRSITIMLQGMLLVKITII